MSDDTNIGILDPLGQNLNPLTQQPYSDNYKQLAKTWSRFPAYKKAREIIDAIKSHQVVLITSGTGSGKTVLVPKLLSHALDYNKKIVTTLPKQIITQSAAEFAALTLDVTLGEEVGYKFRGSPDKFVSNKTKLLYATDGTVVAKLLRDESLSDLDGVVIDEAHERKIQIDFLLYLLKKLLIIRPEFKLIIMSATINTDIFKSYFYDFKFIHIDVGGETNYPIKSIFLPHTPKPPEYLNIGYEIILKILKIDPEDEPSPDILFFVTSSNEALELCKRFDTQYCVEVYSGMNNEKQKIAQDKSLYKTLGDYKRKIVIATNVAESSLTIDGIGYVIDSGCELLSEYNPDLRAKCLYKKLITQAQAKQRMGRAGRTSAGVCYHLYSEEDFNKMEKYPAPDIRTNDLTPDILSFLQIPNITDVKQLITVFTEFIEPPRESFIKTSLEQLIIIGAIDNMKLTPLGVLMSQTTLDPQISLAVLYSIKYFCNQSLVKIAGLLDASKGQMNNIFLSANILAKDGKRREELTRKINDKVLKIKHPSGDHLTMLKVYDKYFDFKDRNKANKWAFEHYIKTDTLYKAQKNIHRIKHRIHNVKIPDDVLTIKPEIQRLSTDEKILYCIYRGFRGSVAKKIKDTDMYSLSHAKNFRCKLSDDTTLFTDPPLVVYYELFISADQTQLNIVSRLPSSIMK